MLLGAMAIILSLYFFLEGRDRQLIQLHQRNDELESSWISRAPSSARDKLCPQDSA